MNRLEASALDATSDATNSTSEPTPPQTFEPPSTIADHSLPERAAAAAAAAARRDDSLTVLDAALTADATLSATTFAPVHYEPGYAYPLLVWLHDNGQTDRDLPAIMQHVSLRNYVAIAPRGELADSQACCPQLAGGSGWCDTADAAADADHRVASAIELASRRYNVRPDRVFLAGVGAGGTAALRVALAEPRRFAGAASFDGPLPLGGRPLRNVLRSRDLPLLLAASKESRGYPEARLCNDLKLLHTAGCQVHLRQYPGDDDLTTTMLSDLDRWMMDIVCGDAA